MSGLSNQRKAQLSEIVDSIVCCADVGDWDSIDDFVEEMVGDMDFTVAEHDYCCELLEEYWYEHQN